MNGLLERSNVIITRGFKSKACSTTLKRCRLTMFGMKFTHFSASESKWETSEMKSNPERVRYLWASVKNSARGPYTSSSGGVEDRLICGSSGQTRGAERDWRLAQAASPSVWLDRGGTWKASGILLESPNIKRAARSPPWAPWAGRQLNTSSLADTDLDKS